MPVFSLSVKWKKNREEEREKERRQRGCCRTLRAAETPPGAFLKVSRVLAYTQHPSLRAAAAAASFINSPTLPASWPRAAGRASRFGAVRDGCTRNLNPPSTYPVSHYTHRTVGPDCQQKDFQTFSCFFLIVHVDVEGPAALPEIYRLPGGTDSASSETTAKLRAPV